MALKTSGVRRTKSDRRVMAEMNVVPYIDVMLVLLVIFMVTAPILTQGVEVNLPKVSTKPLTSKNEPPLIIALTANGKYYLELGTQAKQEAGLSDIASKVRLIKRQRQNLQVLLKADATVSYGEVMQVMAILQAAEIINVGLLADPKEKP